jgi:hypothetical protein
MTIKLDFNHDTQLIYETLTDPEFLVDRCLALGELSAECEVEEDEDYTTISLVREVERDLPRILAKLFDSVQVMEMSEQWHSDGDAWHGDWTIKVRGQPVSITARFELSPTDKGCRYSISHQAKAKIPLVGRQVEKYILGQTVNGASDELEYLRDHLG